MRRIARHAAAAALLAGLLCAAPQALAQCAMCKATVEGSEEGRGVSRELNRAILLMVAAPYVVLGTCATVLLRPRLAAFLKRRLAPRR